MAIKKTQTRLQTVPTLHLISAAKAEQIQRRLEAVGGHVQHGIEHLTDAYLPRGVNRNKLLYRIQAARAGLDLAGKLLGE